MQTKPAKSVKNVVTEDFANQWEVHFVSFQLQQNSIPTNITVNLSSIFLYTLIFLRCWPYLILNDENRGK